MPAAQRRLEGTRWGDGRANWGRDCQPTQRPEYTNLKGIVLFLHKITTPSGGRKPGNKKTGPGMDIWVKIWRVQKQSGQEVVTNRM